MEKVATPSAVVLLYYQKYLFETDCWIRLQTDFFCAPRENEEGLGQMTDRLAGGLFVNTSTTLTEKN